MTDAPIASTFPHRTPKGPRPRKPRDPDAPAHYRLSTETWEIILKEYREGATAPFLASKWRVSIHAVRKRITQHKSTKRDWGDAQAIGQAVAREAELEEARRNSPEAVAARLFDGMATLDEAEAGDPAALMRVATRASGRAMTGRLWSEARALAGLAESYARLAERGPSEPAPAPLDPEDAAWLFEKKKRRLTDQLDAIIAGAPGLGWDAAPGGRSAEELARMAAAHAMTGADPSAS
jgi:hypothetical protein